MADLEEAPWNLNDHPQAQSDALAGAIADPLIGYYGYPDCYIKDDGILRLIDGHLRKAVLLAHYGPDAEIEVNVTDFDEAGARAANLTKDPLRAMAERNAEHLGSGTTIIAGEQLGRKVYGLELSPAYCDVILSRWSKLTGKRPKRESDGLEFGVPA